MCSGTIAIILVLGDCPDHRCARGLSRPPSCSGTVQTTLVLGDCLDHSLTTARGFIPRSLTCARGLPRPLSDHSSGTSCLDYMRLVTRIQLEYFFSSFGLATRLIISPSSKLRDYIGMMHLPVHLVSLVRRLDFHLNWEFF